VLGLFRAFMPRRNQVGGALPARAGSPIACVRRRAKTTRAPTNKSGLALDCKALGLGRLALGQAQLEHAIVVARLHVIGLKLARARTCLKPWKD